MQVLFRIFLFAALGLAWNLVGGYTGQLSLGHAAYFGVGAYGLALFQAGLVSPVARAADWRGARGAFGGVIGGVSFRLRGPYFALSTIAFAEVMRLVAKNLSESDGRRCRGRGAAAISRHSPAKSFYVAAVLLTALAFAFTVMGLDVRSSATTSWRSAKTRTRR